METPQPDQRDLWQQEETWSDRFWAFHRSHQEVYEQLKDLAYELRGAGIERYSIKGLFEMVRYGRAKETGKDTFRINNNLSPFYARLLSREPGLEDFFYLKDDFDPHRPVSS